MEIETALRRLREILPLDERQRRLSAPVAEAHRAILRAFGAQGRPPTTQEIEAVGGAQALTELARNDLVVLGAHGEVVCAYPLTTATTPHRVRVNGRDLHAMCALDALAVAPLYGAAVEVSSVCHVTGAPIRITQKGDDLVAVDPPEGIQVGVRWGPVGATASGSL